MAAIGAAWVFFVGTSFAMRIEDSVDLVANDAFAIVDTQTNTVDFTPDSAKTFVTDVTDVTEIQTAAATVPNGGGTVVLLGSALIGLGCLARFRRKFPL